MGPRREILSPLHSSHVRLTIALAYLGRPNVPQVERAEAPGGEWTYLPFHEWRKCVKVFTNITRCLCPNPDSLFLEYYLPNDERENERLGKLLRGVSAAAPCG